MSKVILEEQKQKKKDKSYEEKKNNKEKQKEVVINKTIIKSRLLNHFKNHIGEENKTTPKEIFQAVIGVDTNMVNGFVKFYWWDIISKMIRKLRKEDKCFIIKKDGRYFVLKANSEAEYFKKVCNRAINGMERIKVKADDWVKNKKWEVLEDYKEEYEAPKKEKSPIEIIDERVSKFKTKVIKLWKDKE